jgi:predicted TIM-barrel fold metal-dependent hydrolase
LSAPARSAIDVDALVAIDVHTHVLTSIHGGGHAYGTVEGSLADTFGGVTPMTLPEMADYYRDRKMAAVVFMVDKMDEELPVSNDELLALAAEHRDVIIPFASVDPRRGAEGVALARRLIADYDVHGFKFHPSYQAFFPDDKLAYPLYELIAAHRLPAIFHTGQTALGAGLPGGGGIRLKYSNPIHLDDVAADFPEMPIILAHPSVPWQDEALSVAVHKPQVYIDLSGWSPKYFPPQLVQYANTLLREKVMFGTDYPALTPERWMAAFEELAIKPEVRPLILKENAARLLGLRGDG